MIRTELRQHTAFVTLDNPPANTWTPDDLKSLEAFVRECEADREVYAMVLTGHGEKFFSAGADLKNFQGDKVFASIVNTSSGRCWASDTYNPYPGVLENVPSSRGYSGGFGADLMLKDLTLVTDAAKSAKQPVMLGALAQQIYQKHSVDGHGAKDFSSVILQYMKAP